MSHLQNHFSGCSLFRLYPNVRGYRDLADGVFIRTHEHASRKKWEQEDVVEKRIRELADGQLEPDGASHADFVLPANMPLLKHDGVELPQIRDQPTCGKLL
jgi:hypothetical protein